MADLLAVRERRLDAAARITRGIRLAATPLSVPLIVFVLGAATVFAGSFFLPRLDAVSSIFILTFVAIFVGSLSAGLAGFAFSAVTGALLLHWLAPAEAVPLLLACSITTQLFSITALWRCMQWRECIPLLLGGLPGIPVGAYVLQHLRPEAFAGSFGVFLVGYAIYMLWRPAANVARGGRMATLAVGFAGGISGGAVAFPGAFPAIWFSLRGLPKDVQRGTVQPFILLMQCAALVYFSKAGMLNSAMATTFVWCVPAVLAGSWIGIRLYSRIDDTVYRRVFLGLLLISGVTFIV
jgi:uncharacterized membrane protein YfcA